MAWYKCIGNGGSPIEGDPYIVGMGTAYSELPVYSDENDILKIKFKFKNTDETTDNKTVIGSAFSGNGDYLLYMSVENGQPIYSYAVANNYTYIKAPRSTTDYDDIELGYDYMIVNGTTYTSQTPAKHISHNPIYLFGSAYTGSGVFGEVKIYKNDVLTYDLVPSLNSSGVACFKDVLNSDTEYLSTGTEYYYFKDGGGYKQMDYSLTEQDTGITWVDGKKVYQKSYTGTIGSAGPTLIEADFPHTIIGVDAWFRDTSGLGMSCGNLNTSGWLAAVHVTNSNNVFNLVTYTGSALNGGTYLVTVRYTKD